MKAYILQILLVTYLLSKPTNSSAEIITDGSVGTAQTLSGPHYIIGQELGTRAGNNLFHSFKSFNLNTSNGLSESATFTGSADIKNVISRVTGGELSTINGSLTSEIGQANFYFLNPAGVIFGEQAKINVPAAFHISTANALRFSDGTIYYSDSSKPSTLGIAQPEAFGFLKPQQDSTIAVNGSQLNFTQGSQVSVIANTIFLTNSLINNPEGNLYLFANGSQTAYVNLNPPLSQQANGSFIANSSLVNTSGNGAGNLEVGAKDLLLNGAIFLNSNLGSKPAEGKIHIQSSTLQLYNGGQIGGVSTGAGKGPDLYVDSDYLLISGISGQLTGIGTNSTAGAKGNAGNVIININESLELYDGAEIFGSTASAGNAGNITINAKDIRVKGIEGQLSQIASNTFAEGHSGDINITVDNALEIFQFAEISDSTTAVGNAGSLTIQAKNIHLDNQGSNYPPSILSSATPSASGLSGSITIKAENILLVGSNILVSNLGTADIKQFDPSQRGVISIDADNMILSDDSQINAGTTGRIPANNIYLSLSDTLYLNNMSEIVSTGIEGDAGNITITAKNISIIEQSLINNDSQGSGDAGNIQLSISDDLTMMNQGFISSSTDAQGNAGGVSILANNINMANNSSIFSAATNNASGSVGDIIIKANSINLENAAAISIDHFNEDITSNSDNIQQGSLSIDTQSLRLVNGIIGANAYGSAPASNIKLTIADNLWLINSAISSFAVTNDGGAIHLIGNADSIMENSTITTSTKGGNGGDIIIQSNSLIMDGGFIQANTSGGSQGGDITIHVPYLITRHALSPQVGGSEKESFTPHSGLNIIQAAAPEGNPGELALAIPNIDISNSLAVLSSHFMQASNIADNPCSANKTQASSLISTGRGGIPHEVKAPSTISLGAKRLEQLRDKRSFKSTGNAPPKIPRVAQTSDKKLALWGCHSL